MKTERYFEKLRTRERIKARVVPALFAGSLLLLWKAAALAVHWISNH